MEIVDDGSASPESADENHTSEDQTLSKNRSKRKPSKTQIKHIAQDAFSPPNLNGQIHRPARDSKNDFPNTHNHPPTERRKMATSQPIVSSSNLNCNTSASNYIDHNTDGLFTSGNQSMDQCANNIQQEHSRGSRRVKWSPKVVKQPSVTNTAVQPGNIQSSLPGIVSSRSSMGQSHTSSANTSPRSMSGRPSPCYPCAICGKVFRVPSRFDSHMLGHSKGKPFCCNTCGKMFASQEKLDRHLPVHNCDRHAAFTCETCGKVCVNWRAYLYHIKAKHTESGGKRFSCNLCGRQFHSGQRLRNHMASHEVGKNHCCHVCGKLFESNKKLAIHSLVHNLSSMHDQNLQCIDCGRQYTEWIAFKQHMKTHGTEGVHYPCGICGETFTTQYEKEKHKRVHKQVQCGICNRYFRSSSVLSVHLRIHTGEKPYKCGLCDKEFSQLSVMKIHMRIHIKDGRYDCKICTAIFSDVMDYFKHYVAHFEDGNLQCEICGKIFDNIKKKNRHMAAHQDKTDRQCRICGKEFGRVSHLEAHMQCHSDNTPLMCKVCGKMFSSEEVLTAHYSVHVKPDLNESEILTESPLFCGLCGKMFKDQEYLNKHMKRHERNSSENSISLYIKSEDVMLDEDIVEVLNGQYPCNICGKTFGNEDHLAVHSREHDGLKPHICVMCGQSFMLRKLLFEHGLTHRSKDLISSSTIHQHKMESGAKAGVNKVSSSTSSLGKHNGESDSCSSSETDTDCDHEENVRQSKGKPQISPVDVKSGSPMPQPSSSSVINHSYAPNDSKLSAVSYSSLQTYTLPQIESKKLTSSPYVTSTVSVSPLSPTTRNQNESHSAAHQLQDRFSYRDNPISSHSSNQLPQTMLNSLDSKNNSHNVQQLNLQMLRPEPHMPVEMHMSSTHQDFKTDVKMSPLLSVQKSDPNSSYTCASCGKICVNWRAYVYHQRSRHSETDGKNFSCNLCGRQFYTRHRLKKHTLGHEKGKHHCCHVCGKLFESSKKLTTHSLVHNLSGMHDQNLQCGDCGRKYSDWIPFKQHMKTHGAEGVCYPCGHCEETFPTQYDLEKHRRVHKQFQCEFCDRFFRSASVLSVHLRVHTGERPYRCGLCDRDFSQSCVLKVHMRTHAKEERYECKLCGLVLHDVMGYFRHHVAHLEEGNLQCEECGKMFDNINNKNRHMATHRDRDGRQCHVCGKEFGRVSHLEAHMLSHSDSDPIPLTCKVCSKAFSSQDLLTAHYSTHMTGDLSSSDAALSVSAHDSSPLFCGVCGKMFKDREYLNKHMKKHDNEAQKSIKFEKFVDEDVIKVENGQFACIDCDKTFGKADHLAVHRREHTGECPHSCCMCEQSFMLRSQLLMHIREHRQSGVMMYLNLDAGEVCATMSEVKDVLTFSNTDDALSGTGTETSVYHREQRSKTKETSSHSGPQQQSIQSQSVDEAEKNCPHSVQNQTVTAKSNSDIIQHRYSHQNQILQPGQQLGNQDNRYQLHNPSSVSSDQNQNSPKFISVSINNQDIVSTSMAHHQIPLSHKKRELTSHPHLLKAPYSEAVPISMLGTPVNHVYSTSAKEGSYLFSSHNPSHPVSSNDQTPTGSQTAGPGDGHNNGHLQHGIQVMRPEQTHAPIAMTISNNLHPKTNSSHHDAPFSYTRTLMASPSTANVLPHHHPLSLPSTIHVQASRFNPDIHHTLSNFQLLPQTAFPENFHHM